jgi:outer membrane protein assembly factor BamB
LRSLLALGAALLLAAPLDASDWPRFRGPNGTGVSTDKGVPLTFSDKDNVLWKVEIPGTGISSPVVSRGKLFVQTASQDGRSRSLLCLDAAKGKTLWTRTVTGSRARIHTLNSFASATPAADGERVCAAFWDGKEVTLHAFDFEGKPLWTYSLGRFRSQHGAGNSPLFHAGKVVYLHDQDGDSFVVCLDARSGRKVWQKSRPAYRACYSTPFIMDKAGGAEVIVATTAGIIAFDLKDGSEKWSYTWKFDGMALRTVSSPILADGLVLATSGDGRGDRHAIAVKVGGKGGSDTHLVWENKKNLPYVPSLLAQGQYVFSVNDSGIAACHVARTGKPAWSQRLGSRFTASPVLIDGKVYAPASDGVVYVFEAAPQFKLLAKNDLGEDISASPAVADGRLYLRTPSHLFCIGKP